MKSTLILALLLFALIQGVVRLVPLDVAARHKMPEMPEPGTGTWSERDGVHVALDLEASPGELLGRFDALVAKSPRTKQFAGSVNEGLITYVTRSALWGFPDFTTVAARAEGSGTRILIHGRMSFPGSDWGTNRARVERWIEALGP